MTYTVSSGTLNPTQLNCIIVTWWMVLVGFKPDLDDQLVSFSALTLFVWSSGM